ncbi:MAG TPA: efflux RND transporter periplasmic adaptor subunit [Kofleriaceae bacterium]|nr:efflux RND transporter periplasmic adaptor subunit [Kofleriaceae bacterium]
MLALLVLGLFVLVIIAGALPRLRNRERVRRETRDLAIPFVTIVRPDRSAPAQDIVLPGNVEAFANAPIFARANGYLRKWHVDIGAHVSKDQLLAEIDVPELTQQLQQARSTLAASEAQLRVAEATAKRYTELRQTHAVSQQEVDTAVGALQTNQGTVAANQASVRQLEQQVAFAQVRAPFAGIITARNVDVGDLINAGSSTAAGTALFQIAQPNKLRVYTSVPERSATAVTPGMAATLSLAAFPDRRVAGTVVRSANAIDPTTRTLLVEIEVPNPTKTLFSGTFAEVRLAIPTTQGVFTVPVEALLFRNEGLQVATVVGDRAVMKSIVPLRDFGDRIEVGSGLTGDELVILNPPDSIANGSPVRVAPPSMPILSKR